MAKKLRNKYYILRHGEARSNIKDVISCWPEKFHNPLTKNGKLQIKESAEKLADKNIDLIFCSPLLRTEHTAKIVSKKIGIKVKFDKRLREQGVGLLNGVTIEKLREFYGPIGEQRFYKKPPKGESYPEIRKRMSLFLRDIDKKYKGKNILIVSHAFPLRLLIQDFKKIPNKDFHKAEIYINKGEIRELN